MPISQYLLWLSIIVAAIATVFAKKLTILAAIIGVVVAIFIFMGASYTGLLMLAVFFVLGNVATHLKFHQKQALQLAEAHQGTRDTLQVLANALMAAILGFVAWQFPNLKSIAVLMMAACFAAASADTISSEMGNVYGRRFYHILNFKKAQRGLNGVISLEGTLFGLLGSMIIAIIYGIGFGWNTNFWIVIIAGTIGNLMDSILGATLENNGVIGNNGVNFLNTVLAALAAWAMANGMS